MPINSTYLHFFPRCKNDSKRVDAVCRSVIREAISKKYSETTPKILSGTFQEITIILNEIGILAPLSAHELVLQIILESNACYMPSLWVTLERMSLQQGKVIYELYRAVIKQTLVAFIEELLLLANKPPLQITPEFINKIHDHCDSTMVTRFYQRIFNTKNIIKQTRKPYKKKCKELLKKTRKKCFKKNRTVKLN